MATNNCKSFVEREQSPRAVADVQEYMDANGVDREVSDLEPAEFFRYYCEWNGIIGYDYILFNLVIQLLK